MHVNDGARGPSVALVNGIAVPIDLERTIKVRARLDGPFAIVFDFAAPENRLAFFVRGLQLEPNVERVDGPAGEKVADLARSNDYVHANIVSAANWSISAIDGSRNCAKLARGTFGQRGLGFLAYRKGCGEFLLADFVASGGG